ncbi:MAG: WhiB family transcriptional regulator [Acidimicrobiia bacterium]
MTQSLPRSNTESTMSGVVETAIVDRARSPLPEWFAVAACRGRAELFYPRPHETPPDRRFRELRASYVCQACPAVDDCRGWARQHREFGYWGGESEETRRAAGYPPMTAPHHWRARPTRTDGSTRPGRPVV